MSKYFFIKERDTENEHDRTRVVFEVDADKLPQMLEEFENFLKACGFYIDGHVQIEENS